MRACGTTPPMLSLDRDAVGIMARGPIPGVALLRAWWSGRGRKLLSVRCQLPLTIHSVATSMQSMLRCIGSTLVEFIICIQPRVDEMGLRVLISQWEAL